MKARPKKKSTKSAPLFTVGYEQAKAARHPLPIAQAGATLPLCQAELAALIAQVQAIQ